MPLPSIRAPEVAHSSWVVLAALGALALTGPQALAQTPGAPLAAQALPQLRGVVSGRAVVNAPALNAGRPQLTIDQTDVRVVIDWRSFNIGRDAEVLFRQPGQTASALNRIYDANPTVIQGRLSSTGPVTDGKATAGGQIILINQNGILFDRGAQVDAYSLVASTLNLANNRFLAGGLTGGGLATAAFEAGYDDTGQSRSHRSGAIVLGAGGAPGDPGPRLQSDPGGSIVLIAPRIDNQAGIIRSPDGQVLLAAGSKVYLAINDDSRDITLRGLKVEIEAAADGPAIDVTSLIRNAGDISADRGNVTLAALAVNQDGRVSANTAVQSNGSVFLTATTRGGAQAGSVSFGAGSVTQVQPDRADTSTVPDSQSYLPYRGVIEVNGATIENRGDVLAPGGSITLNAANAADPRAARIYLAEGSRTSVAGAWSDVDPAKNLATFRVTSNELKNAPDQKDGLLRGATVTVDLRRDSEILELDGYRGTVARTVAEKAAQGGDLQIASSGSVIQRAGALVDASGGGFRYAESTTTTTMLLGRDGKIYDIATAPQEMAYTAQLDRYERTDPRWGQTISVANPLGTVGVRNAAYSEGRSGGNIAITAGAGLVLDGELRGGVTVGAQQLVGAPRGASLRIGDYLSGPRTFPDTQRIGNTTWTQTAADRLGADFSARSALTTAHRDNFHIAAEQVFAAPVLTAAGREERGFGSVELNVNGRISVPAGVAIRSDPRAVMTLRAPVIDIAGDITLPAGSLTLQPVLPSTAPISPDLAGVNGRIALQTGAELSVAGTWINTSAPPPAGAAAPMPTARIAADAATPLSTLDGGSITLRLDQPSFESVLARGAVLDVGGGGSISANQRITAGRGGRLSISNGATGQSTSDWLLAELRGFALGNGGELSLDLARAQIGRADDAPALASGTTALDPALFSQHGFARISVATTQGIEVMAGTQVDVRQRNLVIDQAAALAVPTGGDLAGAARVADLPAAQRSAASVSLTARAGIPSGNATVEVGEGARISTDARGEIAIAAADGLNVQGRLHAPAGRIGLTLSGPAGLSAADLRLGPTASLDVAGTFVATPNDRGLTLGTLFDAGTVSIDARNAGVALERGARIDVSGASQVVDQPATGSNAAWVQRALDGHAGTVVIRAQGAVQLGAEFAAAGGSALSAGGSFALDVRRPDGQTTLPAERRIVVASGPQLQAPTAGFVDVAVDTAALEGAGFDKLRLQSENRIEFRGDNILDFDRGIRLDAPLVELAEGTRHVTLRGAQVALGQSLGTRRQVFDGTASVWQLDDGTAAAPLPTRRGDGVLNVQAGFVDLYGSLTVNGASTVRLESDTDVRLVGRSVNFQGAAGGQPFSRQVGSFTSAGNLEIDAAQVYPATRTEYTVSIIDRATGLPADGGSVLVTANGNPAGDVYSAGGRLTIGAQTIVQAGTIRAPLGGIDLRASRLLELSPGSLTSVSAAGLTVPYGSTVSNLLWRYTDGGAPASTISTVTDGGKQVTMDAPVIDMRPGATLDLSGGGNVQAVEFVAGNGGDADAMLRDNTYAILPSSRLAAMPYDNHIASVRDAGIGFAPGNGRDAVLYDSVSIGTGTMVPAGEYVLLPTRYALLPGAYLVELRTGAAWRNLQADQVGSLANGEVVAAGFRTARGTTVRDSRSVGVVVSPGVSIRRAADYNVNGAEFFADAAEVARRAPPAAPWDAGRLTLRNAGAVTLGGSFETAAATSASGIDGRVARIDITGARIAVVDRANDPAVDPSYLRLEGGLLSRLDGSVLLGGTRTDTDEGIRIDTTASQVLVANTGAGAVRLPELLLSADETIEVRAGSVLSAEGTASGRASELIRAEGSGALLRLSVEDQARLDRGSASPTRGEVRIEGGAHLRAARSMLVDATRSTQSRGRLQVGGEGGAGGSLALSSVQVSLGETAALDPATAGLVLGNADLEQLGRLDQLVLRGYSAIDLVGVASVGSNSLGQLTLDTPLLRGVAAAPGEAARALVRARDLELRNSGSVSAPATGGTAQITLETERLVLGEGTKALSGFASARLSASESITTAGDGDLRAAAALELATPKLRAAGGSNQTLAAVDAGTAGAPVHRALVVDRVAGVSAAAPDAAASELGGRLTLSGADVSLATTIEAASGRIDVIAHDGDLRLGGAATLDAGGRTRDFRGTPAHADAGAVSLHARGEVQMAAGSVVDVSGAAGGGEAGRLVFRAAQLTAGGALRGSAAEGERSGSVLIDVDRLGASAALSQALNAGGFGEERHLRVRSGDLRVAADESIAARRVSVAVDAGRLDVLGRIGRVSGEGGGRIQLDAGTGVTLGATSSLLAAGTAAGAAGGEVRVAAGNGRVDFDAGASIDVRAGEAGRTGSVTFGVRRAADGTLAGHRLEGTVRRGGASVDLEATRHYVVGGTLGEAEIGNFATDHQAFIGGPSGAATAGSMRDEAGAAFAARILGATTVTSAGDLSVDAPWDLTSPQWLAAGRPGSLTLRARNDLTLSQALGSGDDNIIAGRTWNLRLVAGADLAASNPLEVAGNSGSVRLLGSTARVRTGTGRIEIAAAADVVMDDVGAAIYTTGRIGAEDTNPLGTNRWADAGGRISIDAGRDMLGATSAAADLWIAEWLRRPRITPPAFAPLANTDWWALRPRFEQGVGTLGGGDIDVSAGRNIANLALAAPTSGRTYRDASGARQVDVQGGGDIRARAGGDVIGSSVLVGRGRGRVEAAGDIGATRGTQVYLMGTSSGAVPARADADLVAGGAIALQSVNNPTTLFVPQAPIDFDAEVFFADPSFGFDGNFSTFFSYSSNSRIGAFAMSGDLSYAGVMHPRWRTVSPGALINSLRTDRPGAYPASLDFVAANGDIVGPNRADAITTFPSATAQVRMLAGQDLVDVGVRASDRAGETVITPTTAFARANDFLLGELDGVSGLRPQPNQPRLVERAAVDGYAFELQALEGSLNTRSTATWIELPAQSRVQAGQDIVGVRLVLQNLGESDVSVVRADAGDLRAPQSIVIGGPGRLLLQAGRNIDLGNAASQGASGSIGGVVATGNSTNAQLASGRSARLTLLAGVPGDVDLARLDATYAEVIGLNLASDRIIDLYRQLATESDPATVLAARSVADLASGNEVYRAFVGLDDDAPRALRTFQQMLGDDALPLGSATEGNAAIAMYRTLNREADVARLQAAGSLARLAAEPGGSRYGEFVALSERYPLLYRDYVQRRSQGALPTGVTPIVLSAALQNVVTEAVGAQVNRGNLFSYQTSIQTYGGSDIDLWAPGGNIVVGLTTPGSGQAVGVISNAGGAIRSVLAGNFDINQGKVITAQGGDILVFTSAGSIDAGRGARTSLATPPPVRQPILDASGNQIGVQIIIPAAVAGSGIQSLTSDPDGLGPLATPMAGSVFLFAPAGTIDAGEAGIRSSGNIVLNAQTVLNASNISASGSAAGVPQLQVGSLASSLAAAGSAPNTARAVEETARAASEQARRDAAAPVVRPSILTVEVMGFGERNCKETDKDCFAK